MGESHFKDLFKEELVDLDLYVSDQKEFFETRFLNLLKKGYVKESFKDAIIEREANYPTGLPLEKITIAIPHTDTEHIEKPFVYINRLKEEINFNQMGNEEEVIQVKDVWVLGIKDGSKQVDLLSFIMEIFNDKEFINEYRNVKDAGELIDLLNKKI